jgi:outer membrane protein TolC
VLNRPPHAPVPEPREAPRETAVFEESGLAERLKKNNPELLTLEAVAEKEKQTASLAGKHYYPDFSLGVEYIVTGSAATPGVPDSGEDPVVALLSLNLPIWFNKYRAAEREAELRHAAAVKDRAERENRLLAALNEVLFAFRDAERKIGLYEDTLIPKATQSLKVTQQAFVNAKIGFLDLIEAERTLLAFRLEFERALADRPRRLAEIEMLVGEDLGRVSLEPDAEEEEEAP